MHMYFSGANELWDGKKPWTEFTKLNQLHCLGIRQHHKAMGRLGIQNEDACGYSGLCQLLALWFRKTSLLRPSVLISEHSVAENIPEIMSVEYQHPGDIRKC